MRFDDMLATVIAQPLHDADGRARVWRQLVDLLAQGKAGSANDVLAEHAYTLARRLRSEMPVAVRAEAAGSVLGRLIPAALVAFFAEEVPTIAGPVLAGVILDDEEWLAILPALSDDARNCLSARPDLGEPVRRALGIVEEGAHSEDVPGTAGHRISDLLSRLDAFQSRPVEADDMADETAGPIDGFSFTTDDAGLIVAVEGAPAERILGESIAVAAADPAHGVDGHAAGAWRRRAPFADARLSIESGAAGGEWLISGDPMFEPDGFKGYRATARRPRADETALTSSGEAAAARSADERFERIVDDLRPPLDAIAGFSDIAGSRERAGAPTYRVAAAEVVEHSLRLLAAVDEFDAAAAAASAAEASRVDASTLLMRLHASYLPAAAERGVNVSFRIASGLPPIAADSIAVERMFSRLLAATLALACKGERVVLRVGRDRRAGGQLAASLTRPGSLARLDERALLGPAASGDGEFPDAPLLVLGFALRLVRNLAGEAGGRLDIEPDRFLLCLPLRDQPRLADKGHG